MLRIVFNSTVFSPGGGMVAGLLLTLALDNVLASWDWRARGIR